MNIATKCTCGSSLNGICDLSNCPQVVNNMEKKYPIGGYAPGDYYCTCATCKTQFQGDKMAVQCEPCAVTAKERFDKLDPNEQELLIKRNARIANFMFSGPLSPERELIYRIVEQWGNAIEMPKMEGWLKEYAKGAPTGAMWVKASEFKYELEVVYHAKFSDNEKGAGYFNDDGGGGHIFVWQDGADTFQTMFHRLLILDESAVPKDDWISVNERLPYKDGDSSICCLVNDTYDGIVVSPFNEAHNCWDQEDGDDYYTDAKGGKITHWRPLPPPPKPKK